MCRRPKQESGDRRGSRLHLQRRTDQFLQRRAPHRTGPHDALEALGHGACEWAADKNVPWLFVVTHEALQPGVDAGPVLDRCDLAPMMPLTGMLASRISPGGPTPADVQLEVLQDDDGCSSVLDVNSLAYGMDLDAGKELIGKRSFWTGHVPVLGIVDGKPACAAAVVMVDGYRYVALVATDPAHQRRGFAEAAMRRALEVAAREHGDHPTVLHATEAGRPVICEWATRLSRRTRCSSRRIPPGH